MDYFSNQTLSQKMLGVHPVGLMANSSTRSEYTSALLTSKSKGFIFNILSMKIKDVIWTFVDGVFERTCTARPF